MKPILEIQQISKKFRIGQELQPYLSLRESITSVFKKRNKSNSPYGINEIPPQLDKTDPAEILPSTRDHGVKIQRVRQGKDFWALRDVNFDVYPGDSLAIIGRNGAGKTTLLKILSKITPPTQGKIICRGRVASLLEVGTGFHPELTGGENIFLNGSILGLTKKEIKKKFDEIVDFSGVEKFLDTPIKRFSSGMQLRLAFAVAAHLEPDILVIDEVLAVGDAEFQKKCIGKMQDVSEKEGKTVLFVSHNMSVVKRLCSRGVLLKDGEIISNDVIDKVVGVYLRENQDEKIVSNRGIGGISIQDIVLRNNESNEVGYCSTFDDIDIILKCQASQGFKNVNFAVCFDNVLETRVTSLWSAFIAKQFNISKGKFEVIFHVPSIKLIPGDYKLVTYIDSNGIEIERIDNFKRISVSFTNEYGCVVEPRMSHGLYLENYDVEIRV
ncbi:MAG: ABC transporter ATP-binding protein [Cytophagales bacterium]|nr:ABC transporter ATP-binding protein [Cytophagales bacterium]